jgi:hypothetical protein
MPIDPTGAVNKMEITAMVTSRVPHSMSSGVPKSFAIINANGARIACKKIENKNEYDNIKTLIY